MKKRILIASIPLLALPFAASAQVPPQLPPTPPCVTIPSDLSRGSTDASTDGAVSLLQDFLAAQGYFKVEATGYFGPITQAAVESFQAANGIPTTGYVGPLTRAAIRSISCAATATASILTPTPAPSTVRPPSVAIPANPFLPAMSSSTPFRPYTPPSAAPYGSSTSIYTPLGAPLATSTINCAGGTACFTSIPFSSSTVPSSLCPAGSLCAIPPEFSGGQVPASACPAGNICSVPLQ